MSSIALQRSKRYLENLGWHVEITEKWIMGANIRKDAFGLHDLMAIRHDFAGVWGVQCCSEDVHPHIKKYLNGGTIETGKRKGQTFPPNPHLSVWLAGGNRFTIFGWGKRSADGRGSRKVWTLRMVEFFLEGAEVKYKEVTDALIRSLRWI